LEAKREKRRLRDRRYYQKHKLRKKLKNLGSTNSDYHLKLQIGPTYLGSYIPFHQFYHEYLNVTKLRNVTFSKSVGTKGEIKGLNGTHQYVTGDDYHTFNVSYTMKTHGRCTNPECPSHQVEGANEPLILIKDLKHAETICKHCGFILNAIYLPDTGRGGRMAWTNVDIYKAQLEEQPVQTGAWNGYWQHTNELLENLLK